MTDQSSTSETIEYIGSVLGDRTGVTWFTDSLVGSDAVAGPLDVFLQTTDGAVTWGWSVSPIPIDLAGRTFRRFRTTADWALLIDGNEPELLYLNHGLDLHAVSSENGTEFAAIVATGLIPDSATAFDLEKATREHMSGFSISPAYPTDAVSRALELWCASLLQREITFEWAPLEASAADAIAELTGADSLPDGDEPVGFDQEIADLVGGFASIAWLQPDLTWPDADNVEAFRDHVDVRFRVPEQGIVYLASVVPLGEGIDPTFTATDDGAPVNFDHADPTLIGLAPDRMVLALNRQSDGYEPAGIAVPYGRSPNSEEWAELRRYQADHPDAILIHTAGWSEHRIGSALAIWAEAWSGSVVEFAYDYEDAVPQAVIKANEELAETPPTNTPLIRTATTDRCGYTEAEVAANEDPFPCGRPATHYYTPGGSSEGVLLVCDDHVPSGGNATPLLK